MLDSFLEGDAVGLSRSLEELCAELPFSSVLILLQFLPPSKIEVTPVDEEGNSAQSSSKDRESPTASPSRKESSTLTAPIDAFFLNNRLYSVITTRSIGGFELILLHNPWHSTADCWTGNLIS